MTPPPDTDDVRVLVVAPTRRDGEITCELLGAEGITCLSCRRIEDVVLELPRGVGLIVITEAAFATSAIRDLSRAIATQPSWSDIPILLMTRERTYSGPAAATLATLTNVTMLDRPTSTRSMISAVQAALRARRRQYQIRDQLVAQQQAEQALLQADRRKDEFLATLAHELRNPLAAIRTGIDVFARGPSEAQRTRLVGMIDRQSRMLAKLVDDLMDVSRIATGKVVLQRERIDLRSVLEAGLEAGQTVFDADQHAFNLDLPLGPVWVMGDSARLAQVIGNLVNNAGKYTPDGGQVSVVLEQEGTDAVVRVIDTGMGIAPESLERVFEMFTQVDRSMEMSRGGLGIGLSLVRNLVELHGGSVIAQSAGPGFGSTFVVRLPLDTKQATSVTSSTEPVASHAPALLKVLVVDDNKDAADGLAALIELDGHETRTAYDGTSGLAAAAEFSPDIVFCDIGMPEMTGHEVARRLRSTLHGSSALLIALTGWGNADDKRLSTDAGFDFHITKPVSAEQIESVFARF